MIIRIVISIIDSNNLPGLIGKILVIIRNNIANSNISRSSFNIINSIIVSIPIIETMHNGADDITIIIEDQGNFDVVIVLGRNDDGLHVEVGVVLVAD